MDAIWSLRNGVTHSKIWSEKGFCDECAKIIKNSEEDSRMNKRGILLTNLALPPKAAVTTCSGHAYEHRAA